MTEYTVAQIYQMIEQANTVAQDGFDMQAAIEQLLRALEDADQLQHKQLQGILRNKIGGQYRMLSQFDIAEKYLYDAISYSKAADDLATLSFIYGNLSLLNFAKGNKPQAHEYIDLGIELAMRINAYAHAVEMLFQRFYWAYLDNDVTLAKEYSLAIQKLASSEPTEKIFNYAKLARALVFILYPRLEAKVKGQKLLEDLQSVQIDFEAKVIIFESLLFLLIKELEMYGEAEVLSEIMNLTLQFERIANLNHAINYKVIALLMHAKLAFVNRDIQHAQELLTIAKQLTQKLSNQKLLNRINIEITRFEEEIARWVELLDSNSQLANSIKRIQIAEYISTVVQIIHER